MLRGPACRSVLSLQVSRLQSERCSSITALSDLGSTSSTPSAHCARCSAPLWLRCDVCRRYVPLKIGGLQDVDYRTKTFSCSRCGAAAYIAVVEPINETGMQDYRVEEIERPERHPKAVDRLTGRHRSSTVDCSSGDLPGRKLLGRR